MTLQQEAEEYADSKDVDITKCRINPTSIAHLGLYDGFIAGVNSEFVRRERIQFAIDCLKEFRNATFGKGVDIIKQLQKEL
jgi:hypothetical protein